MNGIVDLWITFLLLLFISQSLCFADTAVLDPALYLYPSPPMSFNDRETMEPWTPTSQAAKLQRLERSTTESKKTSTASTTSMEQESMDSAETFWPRLRSIDYAIKQVHVPVTFSLTGNYGGYEDTGVIGNAYANIGGMGLFGFGKTKLAGSGYSSYGSPLRIYGGNDRPAWSGWGNGKWGHYGKG